MSTQNPQRHITPKPTKRTSVTRYSFSHKLISSIKKLEFWLLPGHCVLCRLATNRHMDLCTYCERDLPWLNQRCARCAIPLSSSQRQNCEIVSDTDTKLFSGMCNKKPENQPQHSTFALCDTCKTQPQFQAISQTFAPLSYDACARWLVQQQKHSKGGLYGRVLAELLSNALIHNATLSAAPNWPDLLIPIPLHWRREWRRGHNQSALLAKHLGRQLGLPVNDQLVRRCRQTASQQSLNAVDRATNMRDAFKAKPAAQTILRSLPNRRIAIIDDVVTTGSTAGALAQVLTEAGAKEIHLWTPTRAILTSKPEATDY